MQKTLPKLGTVLMAAVIAAWVGVRVMPAFAQEAPVAQTGQTTSFAPGDDGDIQAGVPFPVPRFTDNGDGTVRDNLTGLIWLKDARCLGFQTWAHALTAIGDLNRGTDFSCADYSAGTFDDWRLPNVKELHSLIHFGFVEPALSNAAGTAQWVEGDAFSRVLSSGTDCFRSSTTFADGPHLAWHVRLIGRSGGRTAIGRKDLTCRVWPVRGGQ
jgi:hypothetical protein